MAAVLRNVIERVLHIEFCAKTYTLCPEVVLRAVHRIHVLGVHISRLDLLTLPIYLPTVMH